MLLCQLNLRKFESLKTLKTSAEKLNARFYDNFTDILSSKEHKSVFYDEKEEEEKLEKCQTVPSIFLSFPRGIILKILLCYLIQGCETD